MGLELPPFHRRPSFLFPSCATLPRRPSWWLSGILSDLGGFRVCAREIIVREVGALLSGCVTLSLHFCLNQGSPLLAVSISDGILPLIAFEERLSLLKSSGFHDCLWVFPVSRLDWTISGAISSVKFIQFTPEVSWMVSTHAWCHKQPLAWGL